MKEITLKGHTVVGGKAEGEALVSPEPICFLGGVNPESGMLTEKGHALEGKYMKDKILVFPTGKGSTGGSYLIYETSSNGVGPRAILNCKAEAVTTIGAIISEIPMLDRLEPDPIREIRNGDYLVVDADLGTVKVIRNDQ